MKLHHISRVAEQSAGKILTKFSMIVNILPTAILIGFHSHQCTKSLLCAWCQGNRLSSFSTVKMRETDAFGLKCCTCCLTYWWCDFSSAL